MSAEGRNLLEVVLNTNIAKKFNEVDNSVASLQERFVSATTAANNFASAIQNVTNSLNASSTGDFAAKISQLVDSMTRLNSAGNNSAGLTAMQEGIQNVGISATQNVDMINRLIEAINKLPEAFSKANSSTTKTNGSGKSMLDNLLFDTKDLEEKRAQFLELIAGLNERINALGARRGDFDIAGILGANEGAEKRIQSVLDSFTKMIESTKRQIREVTTNLFDENALNHNREKIERLYSSFNRLESNLATLKERFQTGQELQPIITELSELQREYTVVVGKIDVLTERNRKLQEGAREVENYKKRVHDLSLEFERMKLSGTAFDKNGNLSQEAKSLIEEKKALEEKIKLYQMSADEAIKQEQRKNEEIDKQNKDAETKLRKLYEERLKYEQKITETESKRNLITKTENPEYFNVLKNAIDAYKKKIEELDAKIKKTGESYADANEKAKAAYDLKSAELAVKNEEKKQNAINKTTDAIRTLKAEQEKQSIGLEGGMKPVSVEQYRIAIKNLQRQIEQLPASSKGYISQLNAQIKQYQNIVDEAIGKTQRFRQENTRLKSVIQQLSSAFGVYLSLYGLMNFAKNVATVTGEFELQHRALQAIIGDMDAANKLWDKTVRLAVRSPYSVKDLVTYTKQLAAYRVETEKLYDTTKMLADISSGLGVDMQRLILAYGQVKAANYLRGQELRQFSEAGVNILDELAKYFSELRGEMVSTGEVFDMVSKRMVKFEDVSNVLKKLTEEGGIFYNMQEIQAETLKGMFMNLKDSLDLMKNEIGESNKGIFVGLVNGVKYLADNWKTVGNILRGVIGVVVAFKIAQASAAVQMVKTGAAANLEAAGLRGITKALTGVITGMNGAKAATIGFSTAVKNIPVIGWILAILSAVIGVISAINSQLKQTNELQNNLTKIQIESNAETNKMMKQYENLASKIRDTNTSEQERTELLDKLKRLYSDILPQRMLEIEYITKEGNAYREAKTAIAEYYQEKRREAQIESVEAEYGKTLSEAETDAAKRIQKIIESNHNLKVSLSDVTSALDQLRTEWDNGDVTMDNWLSRLKQLIELQTGVKLSGTDMWDGLNDFRDNSIMRKMADFINALKMYNYQMDEIVNNRRFGESSKKVFLSYFESADKEFEEVMNNIKSDSTLTFDEIARLSEGKAEEIYGKYWEEFKKSSEYAKKRWFYDNLFDVIIQPKIDANKFSLAQETIRKKIDDLSKEYNVKERDNIEKYLYDKKQSWKEYYDFIKKEAENAAEQVRVARNNLKDMKPEDLEELERESKVLAALAKWLQEIFDPKKTHGGGNKALELLNKQIDAIKRANTEYKKYQELFDDTTAFNKTKEDFKDLFDELNLTPYINSISSFSDEVVMNAFNSNYLKKFVNAAGKQGEIAGAKFRSGFQYEIDKLSFDEALDKANKEITKIFDQYDFGKELEKLGISKDMGKALFNVDSLDFNGMRQALQQIKNEVFERQDAEGFDGKKVQEWLEKQEEKITELENKAQKERLESYINYMRQAMNQRAQIIYDGIKETADIEMTFQKEIEEARKAGDENRVAELEVLMNRAMQGSKENTEKKLQNQAFEDFKGGELYIRMFEDLDNTSTRVLETMRKRLIEIKESMHELSPTELKAINSEIEKINNQLAQRSSFANLKESLEEAFAVVEKETGKTSTLGKLGDLFITGKTERKIGTEIANNEDEIAEQEALLAAIQAVLQAKENGNEVTLESVGISQEYARYLSMDVNALRQEEATEKANLKTKKDTQRELLNEEATLKKLRNSIKQHANQWKNTTSSIKSLISTVVENIELFGGETNHTTEAWGDLLGAIMDVLSMLPIYVASMAAAGTAVNASLGIIGLIAEAVQLVITLVAALVKMDDAAAQDQIDGIQNSVDRLSDAYDRLKDKFDEAWDVNKLKEYRDALEANIKKQMSDYDAMIAVEKGRKNPDEEQIYEWEQAKLDLQDDYAEVIEDFKKEMGGIGASGFKDAAQEFVDAWADAFIETGDGMEGLMEHFDEVLLNLVKKQAMQRVASRYLEGIFKMIDDAIGDNGTISTEQIEAIRQEFEQTVPQLSQSLKALFESLGIFGGEAENQLSGLEKGIQGVTEETAEIIAAYLNSIRFYIIDTNTKIGQLIAAIQDTTGMSNPMLQELRNIKQKTEEIRDFLYQRQEYGDNSLRVFVTNP